MTVVDLYICLPAILQASHRLSKNRLLIGTGGRRDVLIAALRSNSIICLSRRASLRCPGRFSGGEERIDLGKGTLFSVTNGHTHPFFVRAKGMRVRIVNATFRIEGDNGSPFRLTIRENRMGIARGRGNRRVRIGTKRATALLNSR